ncbi:hypothetical protein [Streptomyces sp. NPDC047028]|uniref:hypothetical protein n=1 Tax=Streptomyces sp. NPDC047028 TaxID=3155793 RepID=UPI00340824B9
MPNEEQSSDRDEREMEALADYFQSTSLVDMESTEVSVEPARYPMVSRSIRMEQATMSSIRKVAKQRGMPVTQLMRQWIRQGLEQARAEEARKTSMPPTGVSETSTRNVTSLEPRAGSDLSIHNRPYSVRLIRHNDEVDSESVAGRRIERKVLQERRRSLHPSRTDGQGTAKKERSN